MRIQWVAAVTAIVVCLPVAGGARAEGATTWTSPTRMSTLGARAVFPEVATAANGDATVIWRERTATGGVLMASERENGGAWSSRQRLSPVLNGTSLHRVVMNATEAVVAWRSGRHIMVASRAQGSDWTRPRTLRAGAPYVSDLEVAMDRRGDVTLVWTEWGSTRSQTVPVVRAIQRDAQGHWGRPHRLSGKLSHHHDDLAPQVAMDGHGNATVLWLRPIFDSDDCLLMEAHRGHRSAAAWSTPAVLSGGQGCSAPLLAMNSRGDAIAAWEGSPYEGVDPYPVAGVRPAGGTWHFKGFHSIVSSGIGGVAIDPAGNATITWDHWGPHLGRVLAARYPAGGPWEARTVISPPEDRPGSPRVAMGGDGSTIVIWSTYDGTNTDIHQARRPPAGPWTDALPLSDDHPAAPWHEEKKIAMDARGHAVVAWAEIDGSEPAILVASQ